MEAFFKKYPMRSSEKTAISMMVCKLEEALKCLKKHKKDKANKEYVKYLADCYHMLEDFFEEKQLNPEETNY